MSLFPGYLSDPDVTKYRNGGEWWHRDPPTPAGQVVPVEVQSLDLLPDGGLRVHYGPRPFGEREATRKAKDRELVNVILDGPTLWDHFHGRSIIKPMRWDYAVKT